MKISHCSTIEDFLNFKKSEIQDYLRSKSALISGTKYQLAVRAHSLTAAVRETTDSVSDDVVIVSSDKYLAPDIGDLSHGWTSDKKLLPRVTHKDVESYLISSRHRTCDAKKMSCYRQFIRGYNFCKERYVHNIMSHKIAEDSPACYVRSKCFASMKNEVYTQWILAQKAAPLTVLRASCDCPAGLGEGCTHIAGLLFSLEEASCITEDGEELPCTSKPCVWNKPTKRKKESKTIEDIQFKKIKYGDLERRPVGKKKSIMLKEKEMSFSEKLCVRLHNSNSVIFDLQQSYLQPTDFDPSSNLNVTRTEEVETSEIKTFHSDRYIDLKSQMLHVDSENFVNFVNEVPNSIVEEVEKRTRGQNENHLWLTARKCRITASIFHDVHTLRDNTSPQNLVQRIIGEQPSDLSGVKAVQWGVKYEPIAKKKYRAIQRLQSRKIEIENKGLFICKTCAYLGASPDEMVEWEKEIYLIEVKCPFKWRNATVLEACKSSDFYCFVDKDNTLTLKKQHRYYTQIQGQLAICGLSKCHLVVYTLKDLQIIEVQFDEQFWMQLYPKLKCFYINNVIPAINA